MQAARQRQAARRAFGHYFAFLSPAAVFGEIRALTSMPRSLRIKAQSAARFQLLHAQKRCHVEHPQL